MIKHWIDLLKPRKADAVAGGSDALLLALCIIGHAQGKHLVGPLCIYASGGRKKKLRGLSKARARPLGAAYALFSPGTRPPLLMMLAVAPSALN